jgi:hypothetical protein
MFWDIMKGGLNLFPKENTDYSGNAVSGMNCIFSNLIRTRI